MKSRAALLLSLQLFALNEQSFAITLCDIVFRVPSKIFVRNRKESLKFHNNKPYLVDPSKGAKIGLMRLASRRLQRRNIEMSPVDGPFAHFTEVKFGKQKYLTLVSRILLSSLVIGPAASVLFPNTIFDVDWREKKKVELQIAAAIAYNSKEFQPYLEFHPLFSDLHKEYLDAKKKSPDLDMDAYLKKVSDRMQAKEVLSSLLTVEAPTQNSIEVARETAILLEHVQQAEGDEGKVQELMQKASPAIQAFLQRRMLLETLAQQPHALFEGEELAELSPELMKLSAPLQKMAQLILNLGELSPEDLEKRGLKSKLPAEQGEPKAAAILEKQDRAFQAQLDNFLNTYWQVDVMVHPESRTKYVGASHLFAKAIAQFQKSEVNFKYFSELKDKITSPYSYQMTLNNYITGKNLMRAYDDLGLESSDPSLANLQALKDSLHTSLVKAKRIRD